MLFRSMAAPRGEVASTEAAARGPEGHSLLRLFDSAFSDAVAVCWPRHRFARVIFSVALVIFCVSFVVSCITRGSMAVLASGMSSFRPFSRRSGLDRGAVLLRQ